MWRIEQKTLDLRFVERNGKRIQQQRVQWHSLDYNEAGSDWRDVPLIREDVLPAPGDRAAPSAHDAPS